MILEAFQGAIARQADAIVIMVIGGSALMAVAAVASIAEIFRKRRPGYQPSSAGERPEPPRSGSGVIPDPRLELFGRNARLRAELENLVFVAQGMDRSPDSPAFMKWVADRLQYHHGDHEYVDYIVGLRERADALEQALSNARGTLEATKP